MCVAASSEGVWMVRTAAAVPLPGVTVEGVKTAVAPVGKPVTVRTIGML